ncbi:DNA recombination protein RmuC [Lampropedia aestuarii]|uniref:DNA recombination protein RmuC n=1 Tax=Lampropedia aestuarii TaxID=2562762 RepID=A0A4S5BUE4_9BURK|nr:DNA recombination protein RmuC [Lampropedia aestuarii]THJ36109.1 DNA recombination protein RmuC [Lampropedia aestuarii]
MPDFSSIPFWALACACIGLGVVIGWWLGHWRANWHSQALQAMRQQDWQAQLEREQTLWQTQLEHQRQEYRSLQQQALSWREALDTARDERTQWQERAQQTAELQAQLAQQRRLTEEAQEALGRLQSDHAALGAVHEEQGIQAAERLEFLERARESLTHQFQQMAQAILEEKSQRFLEQNQQGLGQLLEPLRHRLHDFQGRIELFYDAEGKQRAALSQQVQDLMGLNRRLSDEAHNLVKALKGSSKTQGNWGEALLERILEQAGLRLGQDYELQVSHTWDDGRRAQPDVVINLPGQRHLVVDAKVSLIAYEKWSSLQAQVGQAEQQPGDSQPARAAETALSQQVRQALRQHIDSVRTHIKQLSERRYQHIHGLQALDFVILFVPIEPALMLAIGEDERLNQEAWERNVLLASPSTLLFVLRTVAHLWRQEAQARNAQEIARKGAQLYDRLVAFVAEMEKLGSQLNAAQQSYTQAMHRLAVQKGNVIREAEQLRELGVQPTKTLPESLTQQSQVGL